jgi:pyruvate-ferredoxin/flavodoxin oxidoreductase
VVSTVSHGMATGTAPFKQVPVIVGGRYALASKEFVPAMVKGIFDELSKPHPNNHFTIYL